MAPGRSPGGLVNVDRQLFWCHAAMVALVACGVVHFLITDRVWDLIGPMVGPVGVYLPCRWWLRRRRR